VLEQTSTDHSANRACPEDDESHRVIVAKRASADHRFINRRIPTTPHLGASRNLHAPTTRALSGARGSMLRALVALSRNIPLRRGISEHSRFSRCSTFEGQGHQANYERGEEE
jgi:hypothetical protein